ncbi:hypothetical protein [Actinoplanes sp. NPDC051851]
MTALLLRPWPFRGGFPLTAVGAGLTEEALFSLLEKGDRWAMGEG